MSTTMSEAVKAVLEDVPEGHCAMYAGDHTGDTRTIWNPDNLEEVAAAKATFDTLKGKGFVAYRVTDNGEPGEVMQTFDSRAGKVILMPAMQGG